MYGLTAAGQGLQSASDAIGVYADDLANQSTQGFVAEQPLISEGPVQGGPTSAGAPSTLGYGSYLAAVGRWDGGSALEPTGDPLDVAIEGPGFFAVQLPGGATGLTRQGALHVSGAPGTLVAAGGQAVLDTQGRPIEVGAAVGLRILPDGSVLVAGKPTGQQIGVAADPDLNGATAAPGGVLVPAAPVTLAAGRIVVGSLDASQADASAAVAGIVRAERAYTASAKALAAVDDSLKTVTQL